MNPENPPRTKPSPLEERLQVVEQIFLSTPSHESNIAAFLKAITINKPDINGQTLLRLAVQKNKFELVKFLIQNGAKADIPNMQGETLLHLLAQRDDTFELVKFLIQKGVSLNTVDIYNRTAVLVAAQQNRLELVELLIQNGAKVDVPDMQGQTLLQLLAQRDDTFNLVALLIQKGADINTSIGTDRQTLLHLAVKRRSLDLVKFLLEHDADRDRQDAEGYTPLHWAVEKRAFHLVKLLVEKKANIDIFDSRDRTPLHLAILQKEVRYVGFLIDHGATLNLQGLDGQPPLHFAIIENAGPFAIFLIQRGADIKLPNKYNKTPLHLAAEKNETDFDVIDLIKFLIDKGAYLNAREGLNNYTPLQCAISIRHYAVAELLLTQGADLDTSALNTAIYALNQSESINTNNAIISFNNTKAALTDAEKSLYIILLLLKRGVETFLEGKDLLEGIIDQHQNLKDILMRYRAALHQEAISKITIDLDALNMTPEQIQPYSRLSSQDGCCFLKVHAKIYDWFEIICDLHRAIFENHANIDVQDNSLNIESQLEILFSLILYLQDSLAEYKPKDGSGSDQPLAFKVLKKGSKSENAFTQRIPSIYSDFLKQNNNMPSFASMTKEAKKAFVDNIIARKKMDEMLSDNVTRFYILRCCTDSSEGIIKCTDSFEPVIKKFLLDWEKLLSRYIEKTLPNASPISFDEDFINKLEIVFKDQTAHQWREILKTWNFLPRWCFLLQYQAHISEEALQNTFEYLKKSFQIFKEFFTNCYIKRWQDTSIVWDNAFTHHERNTPYDALKSTLQDLEMLHSDLIRAFEEHYTHIAYAHYTHTSFKMLGLDALLKKMWSNQQPSDEEFNKTKDSLEINLSARVFIHPPRIM